MRTIIAGSRSCKDIKELENALAKCKWRPSVVLSGKAEGADKLGEMWAKANKVPVEEYPADWDNKAQAEDFVKELAGFKRNFEMALRAEALILIWDGKSKGAKDMLNTANKRGLKVFVHIVRPKMGW